MGILAQLHHVTDYRYDRLINLGPQTVRLRPSPHTRAIIQSYSLKIEPKDHFINWQQDPFSNYLARLVFPEKTRHFRVEVDLVAQIKVFNPFDFFLDKNVREFPFNYEKPLEETLIPYLEIRESGPLLQKFIAEIDRKRQGTIDFLVELNQKLHSLLSYTIRLQPGVQTCEQTLKLKSGSCRDMAWLLCQILRQLGLATRFVSGYLIQLKADVKALDGPSGTEQDFTDLHAWTEVYLPGAGWVGLDPTSGLFAGEGHIPLCATPSPSSAAPISGEIETCESTLNHEMSVARIHEDRRVTKPYSKEEWRSIDDLGTLIDKKLTAADVRLTMGGEPTFVSLDDKENKQWHYAATGEEKEKLSQQLLLRLKEQFAPNGLLHYGQGKWYPGEVLPRWAMNCYWRKDGEPLWQNDKLLADPRKDCSYDLTIANQFMMELAQSLGITPSYIIPAREDTPYYLWKEHRLPLSGEMLKADVYEKSERIRLQSLLNNDLNKPVGYVLPLDYSHKRSQWISNAWQFRSGHLILTPGDSPVGFRLPLNSLPVLDDADDDIRPSRSQFEQTASLPVRQTILKQVKHYRKLAQAKPSYSNDPNGFVRFALCAEVRAGVLYLFLPPLEQVEYFIELITIIELVAEKLDIAIMLEGYGAPHDLRLSRFSVTPDPGVIEVNVQPTKSWDELKAVHLTLYEQARQTRLTTEKFLHDGRRVATGGGNHIVIGSAKPEDSPFLRRPDLLRSLVTFWQNHPSLSYLFSSQYIGPTSQAPRIDEARHDSLYELEIAFEQIPKKENVPPWLVDRLFRNLLVDLTGNTHRAEFCIDKLYNPTGETGRLGLLELRGFEMTPHPQMSLLQALLIRGCIAHFWQEPYQGKLLRWGTRLHDQFMLPHFIWEDFADVLRVLNKDNDHFQLSWFEPFLDFRFPHYGSVQIGSVGLELRMALEPWPVMGEDLQRGTVSRAVDSSVERLQIKVSGLVEGRQIVTCNGQAIPLNPTAENGVYVAGIRYKAWSQPTSLHPTIKVHAPLVFDVIDCYHERSIGGCTYYVAHPGGRSYEKYPINENEAESRCLARFQKMGHTPGKSKVPTLKVNPDFPNTLDLRLKI